MANYDVNNTSGQQKRAICLYRVSTKQQASFEKGKDLSSKEPDIPMQRNACRQFCREKGWVIVAEPIEAGISGFKVSAENRDELHALKNKAKKGQFDVLVVFMFDRIGRIASETPFVVEWLIEHGIEVWSVKEGQQKIDTHVDKLTNYLRYWQGEGESLKTRERVSESMKQTTASGIYRGGTPAYGYKLVPGKRVNKKGYPLKDLAIDEEEAEVVRMIFDLADKGMGKHAMSKHLAQRGIFDAKGRHFHPNTISNILKNTKYTGYLTCGDVVSPYLEALEIIPQEMFDRVQRKVKARTPNWDPELRSSPIRMSSRALVAGKIICGHCGGSITLTNDKRRNLRYTCYQKNRGLKECDGQTTYSVNKVDAIVEQVVHRLFAQLRTVPKTWVLAKAYDDSMDELQKRVKDADKELDRLNNEKILLEAEIVKSLVGQSAFQADSLSHAIEDNKKKQAEVEESVEQERTKLLQLQDQLSNLDERYESYLNWSEIFAKADMTTRKLICAEVFNRIEIRRGCDMRIDLNASLKQFGLGISNLSDIIELSS